MSTRDGPSLSGREQAILDSLAAKARADDPTLAAALQGRHRSFTLPLPAAPPWLAHWVTGLVSALVGLALILVALSSTLVLGVVGVALAFVGVGRVVAAAPWIPGRTPVEPLVADREG